MKKQFLHSSLRIFAIVILFAVALNALAAGYSFITDPSGMAIGISTDYLKQTAPFENFLIPGIVLFLVNGVLSIVIAIIVIRRQKHFQLLLMMQGCILVGWIAIQLMMVTSFHPLHAIIASSGVILIAIGWALHKRDKSFNRLAI
jgi:hypothetical protein